MDICYVLINGMLATSVSWPNEMWASATQAARIEHKTDNKPIHNFFISDELETKRMAISVFSQTFASLIQLIRIKHSI